MNKDKELIYCGDEYTPPQYRIREKPTVEVKLHTIATYNNQEYELEELCNGFLEEIERLNNIIKQIYKTFKEGRFEDDCDCIQIEELITRELKGSDKE